MKKPIAVMVNNKEEHDLAIEALDLAGFKWHNGVHLSLFLYDDEDKYICVNPADNTDDRGFYCVFTKNADWHLKDNGVDCEILPLDDFIKLFSSMTEQDAIDFCKLYFEEEEAEEDEEDIDEKTTAYIEIVTRPNTISTSDISSEMKELIKEHWETEKVLETELFSFVAEINIEKFLHFCHYCVLPLYDKDDLLFLVACSLALLQVEDKYRSFIRVSL